MFGIKVENLIKNFETDITRINGFEQKKELIHLRHRLKMKEIKELKKLKEMM